MVITFGLGRVLVLKLNRIYHNNIKNSAEFLVAHIITPSGRHRTTPN